MQLSEQAQATLLLTAWFGKQDNAGATPLTPTEWGRFALFLRDAGLTPADLLRVADAGSMLDGFIDKKITTERIRKLLARSAALGIALEKWQRAGLWVMTRSDTDYPRRWKERLKHDAPPVVFGAGNRGLLNKGGIAVVGSRDLDESQVVFTGKLGRDIAFQGQAVVSGGARGADEAAMLGALKSEGTAVGILADSLLRTCTSAKYRKGLMSQDLALVSPFNPEAGFNVGNAMARNKYIYSLADAAIVIAATENKGGTWSGAIENLRQTWVPLWVRQGAVAGNKALVEKGAHWLPSEFDVRELLGQPTVPRVAEDTRAYAGRPTTGEAARSDNEPELGVAEVESSAHALEQDETMPQETPYQIFLHRLAALLGERPMGSKALRTAILLKQKQLSEWLRQAEVDGVVAKTKAPVTYRLRTDEEGEPKKSSKRSTSNKSPCGTGPQTKFGF